MSLRISHVMTGNVITVEAGTPLKDTVELMNKHEIGSIVILKNGKPVGIITERDLLKKVLVYSEEIKQKKADDIMTTPLITTHPDEEVENAAQILLDKRIKKLPVLEDGKLAGIVTLTDLFRFEPELIRSYTILMRARQERDVLKEAQVDFRRR